jgi:hypothetical protein
VENQTKQGLKLDGNSIKSDKIRVKISYINRFKNVKTTIFKKYGSRVKRGLGAEDL